MSYYHSSYKMDKRKKKKPFRLFFGIFFILVILVGAIAGYLAYQAVFAPNVWTENDKSEFIYISNNDQFEDVKNQLYANGNIIHRKNFEWWAAYKKYIEHIKPGRYTIKSGMSNNDLIDLLRSGNQEPIKVRFNNIRLKEDLANRIVQQINIDTIELLQLLNDSNYTKPLGFTTENVSCMFLPNTYHIFWNTSSEQFLSRMYYEYNQFWTDENKAKAAQRELTPIEVSILASIIDKETHKNDEKARMAGVYLNRLKNGWRLQADPTLI
ncbi:MAG: aminodeoxychorismate lyase, partial [Bacteroidales bacterium]|nr:aminodeoxychorismate lyase [Bacteroidales bacterium]